MIGSLWDRPGGTPGRLEFEVVLLARSHLYPGIGGGGGPDPEGLRKSEGSWGHNSAVEGSPIVNRRPSADSSNKERPKSEISALTADRKRH